jgi:hypothetical protein
VELPPPCYFLETRREWLKSWMWTAGSKQGAEKTERRLSGPKTRILADYITTTTIICLSGSRSPEPISLPLHVARSPSSLRLLSFPAPPLPHPLGLCLNSESRRCVIVSVTTYFLLGCCRRHSGRSGYKGQWIRCESLRWGRRGGCRLNET